MNTFETICSRKSVRTYTGEKPTDAEMEKILIAANAAPVGMKAYDTLVLTVITDQTLLEKIDKNCSVFMNRPGAATLYGAPVLIVVSSTVPSAPRDNTAYSNAAIIVQNMALEAVELGLGACHIWGVVAALNTNPELVHELDLPEGFIPCCALALGKTNEKYVQRDIPENRFKVQHK